MYFLYNNDSIISASFTGIFWIALKPVVFMESENIVPCVGFQAISQHWFIKLFIVLLKLVLREKNTDTNKWSDSIP